MAYRALTPHLLHSLMLSTSLLLGPSGAAAAATPIPHGTLELVADSPWIPAGHDFNLGLHFQLEKGWHIYWVNPGDSGEPPRVTWHLPAGLSAGATQWPVPHRLGHATIVDFGYEDSVTLIVPVHADATLPAQTPAQLGADVKLLVCREMCIPGKAQLSLTLPVKSQSPAPDVQTSAFFAEARESLPKSIPKNWRFIAQDGGDSVVLIGNLGRQVAKATFFPLVDPEIDNAGPQALIPSARGFRLILRKSPRLTKPLDRLKGVLALSGERSYLIDVRLTKSPARSEPVKWRKK